MVGIFPPALSHLCLIPASANGEDAGMSTSQRAQNGRAPSASGALALTRFTEDRAARMRSGHALLT
jgi:hypothetical protein